MSDGNGWALLWDYLESVFVSLGLRMHSFDISLICLHGNAYGPRLAIAPMRQQEFWECT